MKSLYIKANKNHPPFLTEMERREIQVFKIEAEKEYKEIMERIILGPKKKKTYI